MFLLPIKIIGAKLDLPLGYYTEEAEECPNKWARQVNHSAKVSRVRVVKNKCTVFL